MIPPRMNVPCSRPPLSRRIQTAPEYNSAHSLCLLFPTLTPSAPAQSKDVLNPPVKRSRRITTRWISKSKSGVSPLYALPSYVLEPVVLFETLPKRLSLADTSPAKRLF